MVDIEQKAHLSNIIIDRAYKDHPNLLKGVACSFGKDSMLVLWLVRAYCSIHGFPQPKVVFCNTGVECPETLKLRDEIVASWGLDYYEARPENGTTFWTIVNEYGLPGNRWHKGTPHCCEKLKERPALKAYKEFGIGLIFTGITSHESQARFMLSKTCGDYYFAKSDGVWKCHPIMSWTEDEVWQFTKNHDIPINEFYLKHWGKIGCNRVGCMPCTAFIDWREKIAETNPGLYRKISKIDGQQIFDVMRAEGRIEDNAITSEKPTGGQAEGSNITQERKTI